MKILSKEKSREILIKLLSLFQCDQFEKMDKYLNSKPFRFFKFYASNSCELPFLFWDEKEAKKIFDSAISISGAVKDSDGGVYGIGNYDYLDKLANFLKTQGFVNIYGAGNWDPFGNVGHSAIGLNVNEIRGISRHNYDDIYFFDENFTWMLAFNHHRNGFFAGSKEMIEDFSYSVPEFRKYLREECSCCGL